MGSLRVAVLLLGSLSLLAGCNKGAAREALAESEQAVAAARPELEQFAPEQLADLRASLDFVRGRLADGAYTDALARAQTLPARVRQAVALAAARRREVVAEWSAISGRVPLVLDGVDARLATLEATRQPAAVQEALAARRAELEGARRAWAAARATFESGRVQPAVEGARQTQAATEALASRLGMTPAAAMAAAAARAVAETSAPAAGAPTPRPAAPAPRPTAVPPTP